MNLNRMFVIACYYDGTNNSIFNCVDSIKKFYHNPNIVVIDSDSPDKKYFEVLKKKKITVVNAKNKNYDTGAYWYAFKKYKNVKFFYFLQDSIVLKKNLSEYEKKDLTTIRYFYSINKVGGFVFQKTKKNFINKIKDFLKINNIKKHDIYGFDFLEQINWSIQQLKKTNYFMPNLWVSVFGPMFMCKRKVMNNLYKNNFYKIMPKNKIQQMTMERLFGIAFQQEGYNAACSIQGEHFSTPHETDHLTKKFLKRK